MSVALRSMYNHVAVYFHALHAMFWNPTAYRCDSTAMWHIAKVFVDPLSL